MKYALAALVCATFFVPTTGFASGLSHQHTTAGTTVQTTGTHPTQLQSGHGNFSLVIQHGNNSATTVQDGTDNVAVVIQG